MSSSTLITPSPTAFQAISSMSTPSDQTSIETDIQVFWSSFPCPPPWRPRLLIEVNSSRLDPFASKTVLSFLAGKCDIKHVLSGRPDSAHDFEFGDLGPDLDLRPTDPAHPNSSMGVPATSHLRWCDRTCQLSFGCALFVVVAVMMASLILCISRHRVRHKMAATRPSRQQLQLSTSTSDAANCAEFSNLEIQDALFYLPFRHRGLPNPPRSCQPSCDPNWNCPNCSSCHPLMGLSPSDQYYSHTYSAVYETIDDYNDEDDMLNQNRACLSPRALTPIMSEPRESSQGCIPYQISSLAASTVQLQPLLDGDTIDGLKVAETKFNAEEPLDNALTSRLPKYFELEQNCALFRHCESTTHNPHFQNSSSANTSDDRHNSAFTNCGHRPFLPVLCEYPMLADVTPHSLVTSQAHNKVVPTTSEVYVPRSETESSKRYIAEGINKSHKKKLSTQSPTYRKEHFDRRHIHLQDGHNSSNSSDQNVQHKHNRLEEYMSNPYNVHGCPAPSHLYNNIPNCYFCPACQQNNTDDFAKTQSVVSTQELKSGQIFLEGSIAPDLLNEASNHSTRMEQEITHLYDVPEDEASSLKSRLALHSHYFAKSSAT